MQDPSQGVDARLVTRFLIIGALDVEANTSNSYRIYIFYLYQAHRNYTDCRIK